MAADESAPTAGTAPRHPVTKVVIMARGLGTRMRKQAEGVQLDERQGAAADAGVKALISVGRPFLDHVISDLADAGFTDVCLVIGPEHQMIRDYYDGVEKSRITVSYAVQDEPLGTADAVLAAERFTADDRFLVVNSDNFYPADAVVQLQDVEGAGSLGFEPEALVAQSNIPAERVASFGLLDYDEHHHLNRIVEKPTPEQRAELGDRAVVSMNCWLLTPSFHRHARTIEKSPRGEFELVDAVKAMVAAGEPVTVIPVQAGSLDLAQRGDIASVAERLANHEVRL